MSEDKQYMADAQGRLVPLNLVREIDLARDGLVREIVARATAMREQLAALKHGVMGDVQAFVELSLEKYKVAAGGRKGNITLTSYDGRYKVQVALNESLAFDERITAAKALVDACLKEWAADSRPEIQALIQDAFDTDREGRINTRRILALRTLAIDDPRWKEAMQAIGDSVRVASSKYYLRIYERDGAEGAWKPVSLDIAAL